MRYLAGTIDLKLVYRCKLKEKKLECHNDSDLAGCPITLLSTTGVALKYADTAINMV